MQDYSAPKLLLVQVILVRMPTTTLLKEAPSMNITALLRISTDPTMPRKYPGLLWTVRFDVVNGNMNVWNEKYSHLCGSSKTIVWIDIHIIDVLSDSQKENARIPGYNRHSSTLTSSSKHIEVDESIPKPWHWSRSLKVQVNNKYLSLTVSVLKILRIIGNWAVSHQFNFRLRCWR